MYQLRDECAQHRELTFACFGSGITKVVTICQRLSNPTVVTIIVAVESGPSFTLWSPPCSSQPPRYPGSTLLGPRSSTSQPTQLIYEMEHSAQTSLQLSIKNNNNNKKRTLYCRKVRVKRTYSFQRNNLWQFLCVICILPFIKFLTIQKLEKVPYVVKEKKREKN